MISNKLLHASYLLACAASVSASMGCATAASGGAAREPSFAVAGLRSEVPTGSCLVSTPRVIATRVAPSGGLQATADPSQVWLHFTHQGSSRQLTLAVEPESMTVATESEIGARGPDGLTPGKELAEVRATTADPFSIPAMFDDRAPSAPRSPATARIDSERTFLAWTTGSLYTGLDVQVSTVGTNGRPLDIPTPLAHEGSVLGAPVVAVTPSGRGVVAFVESSDHGFQLVAASFACGSLPEAQPPATWAMRTP